jgi:L-iditol 2-dehydrogenase
MTVMRAMRLVKARTFEVFQDPKPALAKGEALLRVQAIGICGSDIHSVTHMKIGSIILDKPFVLGHEFSAIVEEVGEGVDPGWVGKLVAVDPCISCEECEHCIEGNPNLCAHTLFTGTFPYEGAMRDYIVHPASLLHELPEGFSTIDGAMLEPAGIALHSVNLGHVRAGDRVAIFGCGPIGLLTMQIARAAGASEIIAVEPLGYRREWAEKFGADLVLDSDGQQIENILDRTGGRGVDVAFEAAGQVEPVSDAVEVARPGGRVVVIGIPPENEVSFREATARTKGLSVYFVRRMKHTYDRTIAMVRNGQLDIRSLVTHHFPFEAAAEGYAMVEQRSDGLIKAMIHVDPSSMPD